MTSPFFLLVPTSITHGKRPLTSLVISFYEMPHKVGTTLLRQGLLSPWGGPHYLDPRLGPSFPSIPSGTRFMRAWSYVCPKVKAMTSVISSVAQWIPGSCHTYLPRDNSYKLWIQKGKIKITWKIWRVNNESGQKPEGRQAFEQGNCVEWASHFYGFNNGPESLRGGLN